MHTRLTTLSDKIDTALRGALLMLSFMALFSSPASARSYSYFDMDETYSPHSEAFTKWNSMLARFEEQKKVSDEKCGQVQYMPCTVKEWKHFLGEQQGKPLDEQIAAVNKYINSFPYVTDEVNWGGKDFWETPYEFFTVSGNCKDYAIAKYFSLLALGVPAKSMRVIVLQDLNLGGVIHAILAVNYHGHMLLLDNQIKQVVDASSVYHYRPIYAINETGWWRLQPRDQNSYRLPRVMEAQNNGAPADAVASGSPEQTQAKETPDDQPMVIEKSSSIKSLSGHAG